MAGESSQWIRIEYSVMVLGQLSISQHAQINFMWNEDLNMKGKTLSLSFCKLQSLFMIFKKYFSRLTIEGNILNLVKDVYRKPTTKITLNGEILSVSLELKNKTRVSLG